MKLLKRMFAVFASCALVAGLASCGGGGNTKQNNNTVKNANDSSVKCERVLNSVCHIHIDFDKDNTIKTTDGNITVNLGTDFIADTDESSSVVAYVPLKFINDTDKSFDLQIYIGINAVVASDYAHSNVDSSVYNDGYVKEVNAGETITDKIPVRCDEPGQVVSIGGGESGVRVIPGYELRLPGNDKQYIQWTNEKLDIPVKSLQ